MRTGIGHGHGGSEVQFERDKGQEITIFPHGYCMMNLVEPHYILGPP